MSQAKEDRWRPWGHTLSPVPDHTRAELNHAGFVVGEFRYAGPDTGGFYRIDVRQLSPMTTSQTKASK